MAGRTCISLLAGISHEHLVLAVRAAHSGEAFVEISALEEGRYRAFYNRPPVAVFGLESLAVHLPKGLEVSIQQSPQVRGLRITRSIQGQRFEARHTHETTPFADKQITAGKTQLYEQIASICLIDHIARNSIAIMAYHLLGHNNGQIRTARR